MRHAALVTVIALFALGLGVGTASAKKDPKGGPAVTAGFVVFKETRSGGLAEVRDAYTGRVISTEFASHGSAKKGDECHDSRHKFVGARWKGLQPYYVNEASLESIEAGPGGNDFLESGAVMDAIAAGHDAWADPEASSECEGTPPFAYEVLFGGAAEDPASLAELEIDGHNVVEFRSLEGTICDGALACTILYYEGSSIYEVDMAFEKDLTRYGFPDYWTTDDTTYLDPATSEYRFAVIDVSTHEFGHWAGLDHVAKSPALTMYPFIHDGMQTLGLGDLKGIGARYH